jgi:hypothetical protein
VNPEMLAHYRSNGDPTMMLSPPPPRQSVKSLPLPAPSAPADGPADAGVDADPSSSKTTYQKGKFHDLTVVDQDEQKKRRMGISFIRGMFLDLNGFTFPGRWAVTMKRPPKSAKNKKPD